ncbi:MAG: caspase family protein [Saprospiraceae bacterium]|nr:caspase family protein [Saprospiraceae bacterium]
MNLRKYYSIALYLICTLPMFAQENVKLLSNWDYRRKMTRYEKINKVISTGNGYIAAVGETHGESGDIDGLFILMDAEKGETQVWKSIGREGQQSFQSIVQNFDGTFTLVGYDERLKGERNGWLVDVDIQGNELNRIPVKGKAGMSNEITDIAINGAGITLLMGKQNVGKSEECWLLMRNGPESCTTLNLEKETPGSANQLIALPDGYFALVGSTDSKNREHPNQAWVAKFDHEGKDVWSGIHYIGDKGWQEGISICPSPLDGGIVLSGVTNSKGAGDLDMWLVKLNKDGELEWDRTFGGINADRTASVVALSAGGYALMGHTWSHLPKASTSILKVVVVNNDGEWLDDATYYIPEARGSQTGYSICESLIKPEVIIAGNSTADKSNPSLTYIADITYQSPIDLALIKTDDDTYGNIANLNLELSSSKFVDADASKFLQEGERGYVTVDVTNSSLATIHNVKADISSNDQQDIKFWNQIYMGSFQAGQSKTLRIPVEASNQLTKGSYQLNINLEANGMNAASSQVKIASNRPDPASLIVNRHSFSPEMNANPGNPITLTVELINNGGTQTDPVTATFSIPSGVESLNNEKVEIPALAPNDKYSVTFDFAYSNVFDQNSIKVEFESETKSNLPGIKRSFSYGVASTRPVADANPPAPNSSLDIIWTSHDLNEYRTVEVTQREVNIKAIALANKELSKRNFAVLINGRRSQGQKLDESRLTPPEGHQLGRIQQSYTDVINLRDGDNEVQVVYYDDAGEIIGKSTPLIFKYLSRKAPNLYVLSIGVQHEDLQYTVNDAKKFAEMYGKLRDDKGRTFRKVSVIEMTTKEETTERNIKRAFLNLSRNNTISDDDLIVVFISSHGKVMDGNRYVLLPSDYDPQYEEITTVDFDEDILKRLRNLDGKKLLFIDACHSGSAGSRSFSDAAASKMVNDLINSTAGMEIFASCANNEFSYEDPQWNNGAFTKAIIEAFNNETVDIDGNKIHADKYTEYNGKKDQGSDGIITIEELKEFVQQRVPYLVKNVKNKEQNPTNKSTELLKEDLPIYLVN